MRCGLVCGCGHVSGCDFEYSFLYSEPVSNVYWESNMFMSDVYLTIVVLSTMTTSVLLASHCVLVLVKITSGKMNSHDHILLLLILFNYSVILVLSGMI